MRKCILSCLASLLILSVSCSDGGSLHTGGSYTVVLTSSVPKAIENPEITHIRFSVYEGQDMVASSEWGGFGSSFSVEGLHAGRYGFAAEGGVEDDSGIISVAHGRTDSDVLQDSSIEISIDTANEGTGAIEASVQMPQWMPEKALVSFSLYPVDGDDGMMLLGSIRKPYGTDPVSASFSGIASGRYILEVSSETEDGTVRKGVEPVRIFPGIATGISLSIMHSEPVDGIVITPSEDFGSLITFGDVSYEVGGTDLFLRTETDAEALWFIDGERSVPSVREDGSLVFSGLEPGSHILSGIVFDGKLLGAGTVEIGFIVSSPHIVWPEIRYGSSWVTDEGQSSEPEIHFTYEYEDEMPIEFLLDGKKLTDGIMSLELEDPDVASLRYDEESDIGYLQPEGEGTTDAAFLYAMPDGRVYRTDGIIDVHGIRIDYNGIEESPGDYLAVRLNPQETVTHRVRIFDKDTGEQVTDIGHLQMFIDEALATFEADFEFSPTASDHTDASHTETWGIDEAGCEGIISYTNNNSRFNLTAWLEYRITEFIIGNYHLDFSTMETIWRNDNGNQQ